MSQSDRICPCSRATLALNIFISKWLSNTLPTGMVLQRRQHRLFNWCPRCNHWGEDKLLHILVCKDVRAKVIWDKQMQILQSLLITENTQHDIMEFIIDGMSNFCKSPTCIIQRGDDTWECQQTEIGGDTLCWASLTYKW